MGLCICCKCAITFYVGLQLYWVLVYIVYLKKTNGVKRNQVQKECVSSALEFKNIFFLIHSFLVLPQNKCVVIPAYSGGGALVPGHLCSGATVRLSLLALSLCIWCKCAVIPACVNKGSTCWDCKGILTSMPAQCIVPI